MKICTECEHCSTINSFPFDPVCRRPLGVSLIDGKIKKNSTFCCFERETDFFASFLFNYCGKKGRFFEKKISND